MVDVSGPCSPATRTSPRRTVPTSIPTRFTATLVPDRASSTSCPSCCSRLIRARPPPGRTLTWSPRRNGPSDSVPVTTVPEPSIENARSIHSRADRSSTGRGSSARPLRSSCRNRSRPCPVGGTTWTMGASAKVVPCTRPRMCESTSSARAPSTRSTLVIAMAIPSTPSRSRMSRCSRVCTEGPSSAATTSSAAGETPEPAIIVPTSRACPGTSTNATREPTSSSSAQRNPSSIVRPRRRSSGSRSGCIPVSARSSVDLPWSTCPARVTTRCAVAARLVTPVPDVPARRADQRRCSQRARVH